MRSESGAKDPLALLDRKVMPAGLNSNLIAHARFPSKFSGLSNTVARRPQAIELFSLAALIA